MQGEGGRGVAETETVTGSVGCQHKMSLHPLQVEKLADMCSKLDRTINISWQHGFMSKRVYACQRASKASYKMELVSRAVIIISLSLHQFGYDIKKQ